MAVKVVTDSTADLPAEVTRELDITVVPLTVFFGDDAYSDGVDITPEEFFGRLTTSGVLPRTSQPSVGAFAETYSAIAAEGHDIVSVHISGKLSGTMNSARAAVQELPDATKVELVDAMGASLWTGLVALAAARAAKGGASLSDVAQAARDAIDKSRLYFVLDTLEYLQKGGRIGKAAAVLGGLLSIKPVLSIREGEVHSHERVRTRAKSLARIRELVRAEAPCAEIAVLHATSPDEMQSLAADLQPLTDKPIIKGRVGPVIGTYTGPGVLGVALLKA